MARTTRRDKVRALLDTYGRTYADEAGIRLADTPQPLYRLLVLAGLLSARIRAGVAVAASKELSAAGLRSPRAMAAATWQQRVDALGRGGYRRYDERTATQLGDGAELAGSRYGGDLRGMRARADGDVAELRRELREFPGMGPAGADIFLREAQAVWPEVAPYLDAKTLQGARLLGLPEAPARLTELADGADPSVLAAALARVALDKDAVRTVEEAAAAR
ncbi:putative endonuclease III-like protein [Actinacidiphila reveromycinica]|uniref:Putative endonuclease III-like protein n=1 Tax=Actinacidiphila reveromycinica TaxID=659352 RepID=A0A7U3UNK0_9ACTN|nr:endonuclease [Streptomyces sp. SN-593]BBA95871.1 putative endonuclease III-like protein [Streptomyces sp. SN-593]